MFLDTLLVMWSSGWETGVWVEGTAPGSASLRVGKAGWLGWVGGGGGAGGAGEFYRLKNRKWIMGLDGARDWGDRRSRRPFWERAKLRDFLCARVLVIVLEVLA